MPLRSCAENISWAQSRRASPRDRLPVRDVSARLLSDVRLICNSSPFCSDKRVGVLHFQGEGRGRDALAKRRGINTRQIVFSDTLPTGFLRHRCATRRRVTGDMSLFFFLGVGGAFSQSSSAPPTLVYRVSVTCPSASRVRHVRGVKNKEAKTTDARREEKRRGEEGEGEGRWCDARRRIINPSLRL